MSLSRFNRKYDGDFIIIYQEHLNQLVTGIVEVKIRSVTLSY